mmetsp:Transcript_85705/g.135334  ORF Transcript_85705/g.135334 Transcript_85705/m.135334 type:complete len:120 (-) Transcript_85705:78-437(-)|eukprot:CAMPEP_0169070104 /NCGR_PEP_ID=MMETSP1015-20121227/4934_1 /TAXON_ID=342587 /ORGANISM="Karlodinium micrum, Strain CCMP2283" /LENGTH=119 /DNA_ID=CAMNT_0009129073 /DNA_START=66 /DNA_END=425 /DNA_ORIENTATION=-
MGKGHKKSKAGRLSSRKKRKQNVKTRASVIAKKKRTKDIDQVHEDLKTPQSFAPSVLPKDEDLPGLGQYYCIACNRYFQSPDVKAEHERSKLHKRRLKKAQDIPHNERDAEIAAGMTHE